MILWRQVQTDFSMKKLIRIGTRESQLAVWQATVVQHLLRDNGFDSELVYIKSEGDIDLQTPLYEMGVQGIFTKSLDIALLNNKIDIAVHSMKDVPVQLARGIVQAAVLKRGSYKDILVPRPSMVNGQWSIGNPDVPVISDQKNALDAAFTIHDSPFTIATSSIRRKAQWLHRYPNSVIENLRGNVNTRLRKLEESNWHGAIFAAAGLERIGLRPENAIDLDWMLPAPAQGAIVVVCRQEDEYIANACNQFNDVETQLCVKLERDFLKALLGGCSTPISALATVINNEIFFQGNIVAPDGSAKAEIEMKGSLHDNINIGIKAAAAILEKGGKAIMDNMRHAAG
jgi:hydroxymethylbilane synthase